MELLMLFFVAVIPVISGEHLKVSGSHKPVSASVGEDVTLNCSVDSHITPEHIEEVSWKKKVKGGNIVVLLYQNNETLSDSSDERYRDRVEFFTAEIPKGNFSLRLKSVRTEDKGVYMCQVFAGGLSANATVVLKRLGFSVSHVLVLILCISASGSALLLCFLIYCRSHDKINAKGFLVQHYHNQNFLGSSMVLPCYCIPSESLKVEWRRTDSETLVLLYQNGQESRQQDYHDRAHFITDQIQHGNFSLCLENLTAKDEGEYSCRVYSDQDCVYSSETNLTMWFEVEQSCEMLVPLGSSVVLPCYADKHLKDKSLKVEWRRKDPEKLVHLYQDGKSQQQKDYCDRVNFFTNQFQHGNFSLCLDNLRAEDAGQYTCTVYRNQTSVFSSETNLELKLQDTVFRLQMYLIFCPNMIMFFSFVLWGVIEGSLNESASCCALYFLRPLMLLWAAPYAHDFTGKTDKFIQKSSYDTEYIVLSTVFYSVLFKSALDKNLNYTGVEGVTIIFLFVIILLLNLIYIVLLLARLIWKISKQINTIFRVLARISFDILPSLQFLLLFFAFGSARSGFITVAVLPVFLTLTRYDWDHTCGKKMHCSLLLMRSVWFMLMLLVNAIMVYFYTIALGTEKDRIGWACMIAFLQLLWALINFTWSFEWDLHSIVLVYVFGSVGIVLLNSVTLMTELIFKTINGEGVVGDLRVVVFTSEFIFTLFLLVLLVFEPWIKPCLQSCKKAIRSSQTPAARLQNQDYQNVAGSDEIEMQTPLNKQNQTAGRREAPDSVVSQA
ncbi:hypothetical protein QQF64_025527 [Cirrhinus molitorella]|uniref:Ig-like domain-containing protein n=1 Tax=Cirrhinus molitorella TaxID=172907 RepID=A0ABR3NPL1_9TELE